MSNEAYLVPHPWEEVIRDAGTDNTPSQGKARAKSTHNLCQAIESLTRSTCDVMEGSSKKIDLLNNSISEANRVSEKLSKRMVLLTVMLVVASVVQACAAVVVIFKA